MPDVPDFEAIAETIIERVDIGGVQIGNHAMTRDVAKKLRSIWNARGAADLETIESVHATLLNGPPNPTFPAHVSTHICVSCLVDITDDIEHAIRTLDR